jgi:hypothetical protein
VGRTGVELFITGSSSSSSWASWPLWVFMLGSCLEVGRLTRNNEGTEVACRYTLKGKLRWICHYQGLAVDGSIHHQCSPHQLTKGHPTPLSRRKGCGGPPLFFFNCFKIEHWPRSKKATTQPKKVLFFTMKLWKLVWLAQIWLEKATSPAILGRTLHYRYLSALICKHFLSVHFKINLFMDLSSDFINIFMDLSSRHVSTKCMLLFAYIS